MPFTTNLPPPPAEYRMVPTATADPCGHSVWRLEKMLCFRGYQPDAPGEQPGDLLYSCDLRRTAIWLGAEWIVEGGK